MSVRNLSPEDTWEFVRDLGACTEALDWITGRDTYDAIQNCPNAIWLLWIVDQARGLNGLPEPYDFRFMYRKLSRDISQGVEKQRDIRDRAYQVAIHNYQKATNHLLDQVLAERGVVGHIVTRDIFAEYMARKKPYSDALDKVYMDASETYSREYARLEELLLRQIKALFMLDEEPLHVDTAQPDSPH